MRVLLIVLAAVAIFSLGFSLGVVAGVKLQHRKLAREVVVQFKSVKAWLDKWGMYVVGVLLIITALLMYGSQRDSSHANDVSTNALREVQGQNDCLTRYANQLYDSLSPRQRAAERLQAADQRFKRAVALLFRQDVDQSEKGKRLRAAVTANIHLGARLSKERAQNPYPNPPKVVCPK